MSQQSVYLDLDIDDHPAGRLTIDLKDDVAPQTCENFRLLCTGERGPGLCYKGSRFHSIIPDSALIGGDITCFNGTGGRSIYGPTFADENFRLKHRTRGTVSMANCGADTNGSQFIIDLRPSPWCDNKNVVFGHVVDSDDLLKKLEFCGSKGGQPSRRVTVRDCGEVSH